MNNTDTAVGDNDTATANAGGGDTFSGFGSLVIFANGETDTAVETTINGFDPLENVLFIVADDPATDEQINDIIFDSFDDFIAIASQDGDDVVISLDGTLNFTGEATIRLVGINLDDLTAQNIGLEPLPGHPTDLGNGEVFIPGVTVLDESTDGDDILIGSSDRADELDGGAGNDNIDGRFGADTLVGGLGDDTISSFGPDAILDGGDGDDVLNSGGPAEDGVNILLGGAGNDFLSARTFGADSLVGGEGRDTLDAGSFGRDTLLGGAGDDLLLGGGNGRKVFDGGDGDDVFFTNLINRSSYTGGEGADQFVFQTGGGARIPFQSVITDFDPNEDILHLVTRDFEGVQLEQLRTFASFEDFIALVSQDGDDVVIDLGGGDTFSIRLENTQVSDLTPENTGFESDAPVVFNNQLLEEGETVLFPEAESVVFNGDDNPNTGIGDNARDTLRGEGGDDFLFGRGGDDFIVGGAGLDTIIAGDGDDRVFAGRGDEGADVIIGEGGDDTIGGGLGDDLLVGGSRGTDEFFFGVPDSGNDTFFGGGGSDVIIGGSFNDTNGNNVFDLGEEVVGGAGNTAAFGGTGNDVIISLADEDEGAGRDTIGGGLGDDTIISGAGDDIIFAARGNDVVDAGSGDDTIFGGLGDDMIDAGSGDDEIFGGAGNDLITTDEGADNLFFREGHGDDVVTDFDADEDVLHLANTEAAFADLDAVLAASSETTVAGEMGVLIDTGAGDSIFLEGLTLDSLQNISFGF